ncbi:hypothetical protein [Burkholderia sp. BCC1970]|uniref:hypothetical protein n=1 Tax=Burkholderia sp. BCC1970 TaxID=2817437 RepID=UPI002ABE57D9|nr:hypothetical protein [Burkholderia sp. BCC1970]
MNATRTVSDSGGLPAHHIDAFLDRLRAAHYSEVTLRKKRRVLCAFSGWLVYGPFIRDFLDSHEAGDGSLLPDAFDAVAIRNHLLARSKGRSSEYTRLMAVALRSFCHFLFLRGDTAQDLCESVPTVRKWRQSTVPTFLTPEQQEVLITSADRSTPCGRRDYAILLLLARLGLRAGEIAPMGGQIPPPVGTSKSPT